ncbi:MAG: LPS export ABC transporter periplasmic protein LptC, partial [Kangiellaceae bacterium]
EMSILVNPKVYYKSEKSEWQLSANVGRMTNQQSQLFLEDEVELTEKQSNNIDFNNHLTKVTTKNLQINLVTKLAQTKEDVILTAENLTANSIGMKIDIEKSKVHLLSNVRSQLTKIKK